MTDKPEELKPLSAEEQAAFEQRRETSSVIQSKCAGCGAWYETAKLEQPFQETFNCDCGERITFPVPARLSTKLIIPTNEQIVIGGDDDQRLDTGMKVKEAIQRAQAWWEKTGRKEAQTQLKRQAKPVGGADHGAGISFASQNEADPHFLPSGLIHGDPWDQLNQREQLMLVKSWHHFHIRVPDLVGGDQDAKHVMQDRDQIK